MKRATGSVRSLRPLLIGRYLILTFFSAVSIFPIIWLFLSSIKMQVDLLARPPVFFFKPTVQYYIYCFKTGFFGSFFVNSLVVALFTTFFSIIIGGIGGYSLARLRFYGKRFLAFFILSLRMLPAVLLVIPIYILARELGIINTKLSLVITYIAFNLPFVTWMLRSYMDNIPVEVEEAARTDGASRIYTLIKITFPLSLPGLFSTAIFCFLLSWNEFIFATTLTSSPKAQTFPVAVSGFIGCRGIAWSALAASTCIMLVPPLLFGIFAQRFIIRGFISGALK